MIGRGQQQHRGEGGKCQPQQPPQPGRSRLVVGRRFSIHQGRRLCLPQPGGLPAGAAAQNAKQHEAGGPAPALLVAVQQRLDHEGIAQQRQQRTKIRQRIEPVGGPAGQGLAEPGLHQGSGRGEQKVGQADADGQQGQNPRGRIIAVSRLPPVGRGDRQGQQRRHDQRQVHDRPRPWPQVVFAQMGVGIATEECRLKEDQASGPDGRRAAEPGKDEAADQRLNLEQQKSADKAGAGIECRQSRRASRFHTRPIEAMQCGSGESSYPP